MKRGNATKRLGFLDLPGKIRNDIYEVVHSDTEGPVVSIIRKPKSPSWALQRKRTKAKYMGLLQACKMTRREAASYCFENTTFRLSMKMVKHDFFHLSWSAWDFEAWCDEVSAFLKAMRICLGHIRKVELDFDTLGFCLLGRNFYRWPLEKSIRACQKLREASLVAFCSVTAVTLDNGKFPRWYPDLVLAPGVFWKNERSLRPGWTTWGNVSLRPGR